MPRKESGNKKVKDKKERQKREAEERQRAEEEARLIAEREENERLERKRIEEEKEQLLQLKYQERRETELKELQSILDDDHMAVANWESECGQEAKWERYMSCAGKPDPSVLPEINSFISLQSEDTETHIHQVLENCALGLQLRNELESYLSEGKDPSVAHQHEETLRSLETLVHSKLDKATEELLNSAISDVDSETGNMQTVVRDENITLCVWANLSKNHRCKGYQFENVGLGFELPKPLAVCDVAVRILHTRYNHLSHHSKREEIQNPSLVWTVTSESESTKADQDEKTLEQTPEGAKGCDSLTPEHVEKSVNLSPEKKKRKSYLKKAVLTEDCPNEMDVDETILEEGPTPSSDHPVTHPADVHVVDLQQCSPLGGVFYFDLFRLPPQTHVVNGWEIVQLIEPGLKVFPYPNDPAVTEASTPEKLEECSAAPSPTVGVTVTLPNSVRFLEDPHVARWDPTGQQWRTDCISETLYNPESHSISFRMNGFYTFTFLQETHVNMPFQSWELRPMGQDSALFTIAGALTEVRITVQGRNCRLDMMDENGLEHLLGKWMSPLELQKAMRAAGINMFVNECSDSYVSIKPKNLVLEQRVYEQMAFMSPAVAFSWSSWNSQCGQENLVVRVCEHLDMGPVAEEAWSLYQLNSQQCQRLQMKEQNDSFSSALADDAEYHSTFLHALRRDMSTEAQARVQMSHHLLTDTVQKLLWATRVFSYS